MSFAVAATSIINKVAINYNFEFVYLIESSYKWLMQLFYLPLCGTKNKCYVIKK
jgi:hypothetical protein